MFSTRFSGNSRHTLRLLGEKHEEREVQEASSGGPRGDAQRGSRHGLRRPRLRTPVPAQLRISFPGSGGTTALDPGPLVQLLYGKDELRPIPHSYRQQLRVLVGFLEKFPREEGSSGERARY